jgi:co-chaperonin GroES (HSP10)
MQGPRNKETRKKIEEAQPQVSMAAIKSVPFTPVGNNIVIKRVTQIVLASGIILPNATSSNKVYQNYYVHEISDELKEWADKIGLKPEMEIDFFSHVQSVDFAGHETETVATRYFYAEPHNILGIKK